MGLNNELYNFNTGLCPYKFYKFSSFENIGFLSSTSSGCALNHVLQVCTVIEMITFIFNINSHKCLVYPPDKHLL